MKEEIRSLILDLGADVCGFAEAEAFGAAPKEFQPGNIYSDCKSVIVFGKAMPYGSYKVDPRHIYQRCIDTCIYETDALAYQSAVQMEKQFKCTAVPLPTDEPCEFWDEEEKIIHGVLSLRHAAVLAGLGVIGKSALLLNARYGNRLMLGAVLTNLELSSDARAESICLEKCHLCVDTCPSKAITCDRRILQNRCRPHTYIKNNRGCGITNCSNCRAVCPVANGKRK